MTPGRHFPTERDLEIPLLPTEALAHGLAAVRGFPAPTVLDRWRADRLVPLLRKAGWTVVATPAPGLLAERARVLGQCLAELEAEPWHPAAGLALLSELRTLAFDLAPCAEGAA
jgi:hypothetical protein